MTNIYTIGHSNHSSEHFLALLQQHEIDLLIDVRSSPYSRYVPQANRETLARELEAVGITYHWMGDRLGGKPDGLVADYDQLRASASFQAGIAEVRALAERHRTILMCSEGDHRQCHRYKLITPVLVEQGVQVLHVQPDGSLIYQDQEPKQLALF
jgi:uncharacterized protein (DUF488 family)